MHLGFRFDAFGDDHLGQLVRHGNGGGGDRGIDRVADDVANEGPVDLQPVDGEARQVGERGIASAEVVEGNAYPQPFERIDRAYGAGGILHHRTLGQFEFQAMCRQLAVGEHGGDQIWQLDEVEVTRRKVDCDPQLRSHGLLPDYRLTAGFLEHPLADGDDQPGFLGDGDEGIGHHQAMLGMLPTNQGFDADDLSREQRKQGLVVQDKLFPADDFAHLFGHATSAADGILGVEAMAAATGTLAVFESGIGHGKQAFGIQSVCWVAGDADADRQFVLVALDDERCCQDAAYASCHLGAQTLVVDTTQDERELVAADARHQVIGAGGGGQARHDFEQNLVGSDLTEAVIDLAEAVDVEQQQGKTTLAGMREADDLAELCNQRGAARQAGQVVDDRQAAGQVGVRGAGEIFFLDSQIADDLASVVTHRRNADVLDDQFAVLAPVGEFASPDVTGRDTGPHLPDGFHRSLAGAKDPGIAADQFVERVATGLALPRVGVDDRAVEVGQQQAKTGILDDMPIEVTIGRLVGHGRYPRGPSTGSQTRKVVPCPGVLSTSKWPPWRLTMMS